MKFLFKILILITSLTINIIDACAQNKQPQKINATSLLHSYLNRAAFRHKVLSQNIANINTPMYLADELKMPQNISELKGHGVHFHKKIRLVRTSYKHLVGAKDNDHGYRVEKLQDPDEVKPNGNNVSLGQQMTKISQNRTDYNTALQAYQNIDNLHSMVLGNK